MIRKYSKVAWLLIFQLAIVAPSAFAVGTSVNPIGNITIAEDAVAQLVNFTINAGRYPVTVTAVSNNPGLIPDPVITYTNPINPPTQTSTGFLTLQVAAHAVGTAMITVTSTQVSNGVTGSATFTVTVSPNLAPSFTKGADQTVPENAGAQTVNNWASAISAGTGEAGQTGSFIIASNTNASLFSAAPAISSNGTLTYTPQTNASGSATIGVRLQDDGGTAGGGVDSSSTQTFIINVTAPTLNSISSFTIAEDSVAQTVNLSGIGGTAPLTVTASSNNAALIPNPVATYTSPNATGSLSLQAAAHAVGTATITVSVAQTGAASPLQTFVVTVSPNLAPSFTKGSDQTVLENAGAQTVNNWASLISAGTNEAGQTVSFNVVSNTNAALFSASPAISSAGTLTYTPQTNASGSAIIGIQIQDNGGTAGGGVDTSATQTFVINVTGPSLTPIANITIAEDSVAQTVNLSGIGGAAPLTLTASSNNTALIPNPAVTYASPGATGSLSLQALGHQVGSATIIVTVTQLGGASLAQTFTVTVSPNLAPSFTKGADQTVLENAGAQTVNNWASAISAGTNEAGQSVSFNVVSNTNASLFSAVPAISSNGTLTYTPQTNASGSATIGIQIKDDGGTAGGGVDTSATQTFVINVTGPTLNPITSITIAEDSAALTVNLTGIGGAAPLTVTASSSNTAVIPSPAVTYVSPGASGSLSFQAVAHQAGSSTINVTVAQLGGATLVQTFSVTVSPNQAPSFSPGADQTILENAGAQTVNNWASAIAAGTNEAGQTVSFNIVSNTNASLFSTAPAVSSTGTLTYTPQSNVLGSATIGVQIKDNGGTAGGGVDTFSKTFVINVIATNVPPTITGVVAGQTAIQPIGGAVSISPFSTATIGDLDIPVQTLAVSVVLDTAAKGSFTATSLTASGFIAAAPGSYTFSGKAAAATAAIRALVYQPASNRIPRGGSETTIFTISVNDGVAPTVTNNVSSVIVSVPRNTPPILASTVAALPNPATVAVPVSFTVAATDAEGDTLAYAWDFGDGIKIAGAPASVTHAYLSAGTYTATVTVSDGLTQTTGTQSVAVAVSKDLLLVHGYLNFGGANGDSVKLLLIETIDPEILHGTGNKLTISIGGWSQDFTVKKSGRAQSSDGSARVAFSTFKRRGITEARILLSGTGALKQAIYASQTLDASGHPTALPLNVLLNGFNTGGYYALKFTTKRGFEQGQFKLGK